MALIPRNLVNLTPDEEDQLTRFVSFVWKEGFNTERQEVWANADDAYHQRWTSTLVEEESWINDLKIYMPITQMLVDTLRAAMINIMIPNDRYIIFENELVGEFYTDLILRNFANSNWITNLHESILQAAITGDTFNLIRNKGPFIEAVPLSLHDIRVYPEDKDLSKTNRVILLRKSTFDLRTNPTIPYIFEAVKRLHERSDEQGSNKGQTKKLNEIERNEYRRNEDTANGRGHLLLEAHIPYFKFENGREITNVIVTIDKESRKLLRFSEIKDPRLADNIIHTTWSQVTPNTFWGRGVVEPVLPIQYFMNSAMTQELIAGAQDSMSGIIYDVTDPEMLKLAETWENGPFTRWGVRGNPNQVIQPQPRLPRRSFAFEFIPFMEQKLIELTNAQAPVSGVNSPVRFATQANIQFQATNSRVAANAAHWDLRHLIPIAFTVLRNIHSQMFQTVPAGLFGQPQKIPNMKVIIFWMRQVGWNTQKIFQKLSDNFFMSELATDIDLTKIKATGTKTSIDRSERLQKLTNFIFGNLQTPGAQFINWYQATKEWEQSADIPEGIVFPLSVIEQSVREDEQNQETDQQSNQNQRQQQLEEQVA